MEIKDILSELMRRKGVSASQISRDLKGEMSVAGITRILNGKTRNPRPSTVKLLADYFRVAPSILLGREKLDEVIETSKYPAGPLPEGFDPEVWAEVPEKIGPVIAEELSRRFGLFLHEGDHRYENIQSILKIFYYIWVTRMQSEKVIMDEKREEVREELGLEEEKDKQ